MKIMIIFYVVIVKKKTDKLKKNFQPSTYNNTMCEKCYLISQLRYLKGEKKKKAYRYYLESEAWAKKKEKARVYHGNKCASCGSEEEVQFHHITYKRVGGNERMTDLIPLCRTHHERLHMMINKFLKTKKIWSYGFEEAGKEAMEFLISSEYKKLVSKNKSRNKSKK